MELQTAAINRSDYFSLLAVWEYRDRRWKLLQMTRLSEAICLWQANNQQRLVFPTDINPNRVRSITGRKNWGEQVNELTCSTISNREQALKLIHKKPGINADTLALELGIGVSAIRKHLRKLQLQRRIYYCLSKQDKTRLYYPGIAPSETKIKKTSLSLSSHPALGRIPPVKVYFVDPKLLVAHSGKSKNFSC